MPPRHRKSAYRKKAGGPKVAKTLTIDRLNAGGDGMAGDVAVPYALPGEVVEAAVSGKHAVPKHWLETAPERASSICPHFGLPGDGCGGCQMQHVGLEGTLSFKRTRLLNALARSGMAIPDPTVFQSALGSRRRAKLALKRHRGGSWTVGFRQRRSHEAVAMTQCAVLDPKIVTVAHAIAHRGADLFGQVAQAEMFLTHTDRGLDVDLLGLDEMTLSLPQREGFADLAGALDLARLSVAGVTLADRRTPQMDFGNLEVAVPQGSFLQATPDGEAVMQQAVLAALPQFAGRVADLFCGLGTFAAPLAAAPLATHGGAQCEVVAVDEAGPAITQLQSAARRARYPLTAVRRDLFEDPLTPAELDGFDMVVLDPPRAGAAAQFQQLAKAGVPTIVAVSCNPDSLARDLAALSDTYVMSDLTLVDQFLFTPHIEAVAVLRARSEGSL